jgi:hypothetical protein
MTGEGGQRTGATVVELGQSKTGDCLLRHFGEDTESRECKKASNGRNMAFTGNGPGVIL